MHWALWLDYMSTVPPIKIRFLSIIRKSAINIHWNDFEDVWKPSRRIFETYAYKKFDFHVFSYFIWTTVIKSQLECIIIIQYL